LSVFPGIDAEAIISSFSPSEPTPIQLESIDFSDEELVIEFQLNPVVEVTTPILPTTSPVISEINYLIVVGAFSVEKNAYSFASKLTRDGFTVTHHFQSHNQLHLVVVGEFEEKAPARKELHKTRKTAKVSAWLKTLK